MRSLPIIVLATFALGGTALAAERGASSKAPGHEMQEHGSRAGSPGASGYTPGHEMTSGGTASTSSTTRTGGTSSTSSGTSSTGTHR